MKIGTTGAIAAIATLATAACQQDLDRPERDPRAPLPTSETRDSAGILITENARPAEGSRLPWRIALEPMVTIGAVEGEEPYLLQWVRSAFRMSDGRIVVANGGTHEVRVFTATGIHLRTWGGRGQGPAEFGSLSMAAPWPGDSIVAWHSGNYGISFFDDGGTFGHSFGLRGGPNQRWSRRPVAMRPNGTIVTVRDERERATMAVEILDGEGGLQGSLGRQRNHEEITARGPGGHTEPVPAAYSSELVTAAWGDLVIAGPNKPYEIRAFRPDGTLARIVRREHVPVAPTEADRQVFLEQQKAQYRTGVIAGTGQQVSEAFLAERIWPFLESFTLAEHFPAFSTVVADEAGHLWVREYDLPREEDPVVPLWTVFDPAGRVLGFAETPIGLDILQIGEDFIVGRVKDEFEVEYVQVWPLER